MMNGEAPDTFAPHDTVTRAMLVTILPQRRFSER